MLSSTNLQKNLFRVLALAEVDGTSLKIHHKGRVFVLSLTPTGEKYQYGWKEIAARRKIARKGAVKLNLYACPQCAYVLVGDICMNKKCITNLPKETTASDEQPEL